MNRLLLLLTFAALLAEAQPAMLDDAVRLKDAALDGMTAFPMLEELLAGGHRFSGSEGYERAVIWAEKAMSKAGADSVWLQPVTVPRWVRGARERSVMMLSGKRHPLAVRALGGSVGTGPAGVTGRVIEVRSLEEAAALGPRAKGAVIFYNRAFDRTKVNTFEAYGGAVDQRGRGAVEAAKVGAAAVLVRSMTNAADDVPHTGAMRYHDSVPKIPAAAIGAASAERLSRALRSGTEVSVTLTMDCRTLPDVESHSVIGEIRGTERPDEVVLLGAHLDSWDLGTGAHDDGSGVVQCIDVLSLYRRLGMRPKRTVRVVLFANEENGLRGARAYAAFAERSPQRHIAAIETDAGGFAPRGFTTDADSVRFRRLMEAMPLLDVVNAGSLRPGSGGADVDQIRTPGIVHIGLRPEDQRYFDHHHADTDTLGAVHPRELQLGSVALAILAWYIAESDL